ncbi:MAG: hypothetical protein IKP96_06910 [Elusimicrobiaceae bacterium]|nr:hypothetical protein [Elusimicrobiaceae bacterium]
MKRVVFTIVVLLIAANNLPVQAQVSRAVSSALSRGNPTINPQQITAAVERTAYAALSVHFAAIHHMPPQVLVTGGGAATIPLPLDPRSMPNPIVIEFPKSDSGRSWLEQQKRNFKAWQLKRQHARQLALQQKIAALPELQTDQMFLATSLDGFQINPKTIKDIPALPYIQQDGFLYRGLGLSKNGRRIRNILENGLRTQDVDSESNCLLMALSASGRSAAAVSGKKLTNLTQSPELAMSYALQRSRIADNFLPVMVAVTGEQQHGYIVQVEHDIPADQIDSVIALLSLDGMPTWCLLQWEGEQFVITPFERK